jgi:hypothetical protein
MPDAGPAFAGVHKLLSMIENLLWRPPYRQRAADDEVRGEHVLPMVCLVREEGSNDFLTALRDRLGGRPAPRVPYAYADAEGSAERARQRWGAPEEREEPLLPLLDELSVRLAADQFGPQAPARFDYYRLADWLTGQLLPPSQGRQDQQITKLLRNWSERPRRAGGEEVPQLVDEAAPQSVRLSLRLVIALGRLLRLAWLEQRVPGLAAEARWFMKRQPYMVPRHSTGFLGFAERLTAGRRASENEEQIKKLLVHAFLEDLRRSYRRRRWGVFPHRPGWRRTAYTTVLLDNITGENGGCELLRLLSEVRNETGEPDPLLVVAAGAERPAHRAAADDAGQPGAGSGPAGGDGGLPGPEDAEEALRRWRSKLPSSRQRLVADARYLEFRLPPATGSAPEVWQLPEPRRSSGPWPAPWPARRGVGEAALAVAVVVTLLPLAGRVQDSWSAGCSYFRAGFEDGVSVRTAELGPGDRQCLGYSDSTVQIFGTNPRLRAAQRAVFEQNAEAERLHQQNPRRPLVGVVHFAGLTHWEAAPDTDHAAAEELEGLLLRQWEQNGVASDTEPLLRVIVANAGDGMRLAPEVSRELLVPLFEKDPSMLAVVGMDRTVAETEQAITELGLSGIPTLATTLTATGLDELSPLYFQLVPDNARQARLITEYAVHRGAERVTVLHPALGEPAEHGGDSYVADLVSELHSQLDGAGMPVSDEQWEDSIRELSQLCGEGQDRSGELVYYAGREEEFGDFLRRATEGCAADRQPEIIAADAVSRFVAQRERRSHASLAGLPMSYVGMGSRVTLAGRSCVEEGTPSGLVRGGRELNTFCAGYQQLHQRLAETLPEDAPAVPWPAERTGGAYDAAGLLLDATDGLHLQPAAAEADRGRVPHRSAVVQQLQEDTFRGATGPIDFRSSRIGNSRPLAILRLDNIRDLEAVPGCVFLIGDRIDTEDAAGTPPTPDADGTGCPAAP